MYFGFAGLSGVFKSFSAKLFRHLIEYDKYRQVLVNTLGEFD